MVTLKWHSRCSKIRVTGCEGQVELHCWKKISVGNCCPIQEIQEIMIWICFQKFHHLLLFSWSTLKGEGERTEGPRHTPYNPDCIATATPTPQGGGRKGEEFIVSGCCCLPVWSVSPVAQCACGEGCAACSVVGKSIPPSPTRLWWQLFNSII